MALIIRRGIDLLRELSEFFVRLLLFVQRLLEESEVFGFSQQFCKGANRSVCRNLVVFDTLGRPNQRCVHDVAFEIVADNLGALFDEPFHSGAFLAAGAFAQASKICSSRST